MTLREFTRTNINPHRGGYSPDEVMNLVELAWKTGAREVLVRAANET